jgi:hypothetical protein
MRALLAVAIVALGIESAAAADIDFGGGAAGYLVYGERAGQIVTYDFQPGVVIRPYWHAPWHHRHYFPIGDGAPKLGRHEDLSAASVVSGPPEDFRRYWSTTSILPAYPRMRAPNQAVPVAPDGERFTPPPLTAK